MGPYHKHTNKQIKEKILNVSRPISSAQTIQSYTKLPYSELLDVTFQLINFVAQVDNKSFIKVSAKEKASYGKKDQGCIGFTFDSQ